MRRALTFGILSIACIGCDQGTKVLATHGLRGRGTMSFLADTVRLQYVENTGAFLGLGADLPASVRFAIFTAATAIMLVGIIVYMFRKKDLTTFQFVAFTLVVAGGTGNMIDRLFGGGRVVDFLNLGVSQVRTGIFNVADVAIMAGGLALLLVASRPTAAEEPPPSPPT